MSISFALNRIAPDVAPPDGSYAPATAQALGFRETLVSRLINDDTISGLVGKAVHPGCLPQSHDLADGPAIVYQIIASSKGQVLSGSDGTCSNRVQFSAFAYKQSDVDAIVEALFPLLNGPPSNPWATGGVTILSSSHQEDVDMPVAPGDGSDRWIYQTVSEYIIRHVLPS